MFDRLFKFNPHHDKLGRFARASADAYKGSKATAYAARASAHPPSVADLISKRLSPADAGELRTVLHGLSRGSVGGATVGTTEDQHSVVGKNGGRVYTKERQKLHREIVDSYFQKYAREKGDPPEMIILGGLGGSGKSSFGDKANRNPLSLYKEDRFMVIDSDKVKELIPGFNGANAAVVHNESSYVMDKIVAKARALGHNVVLDQTLNHAQDGRVMAFKKAGYKTKAYYMFVPPAEAAGRALDRWKAKGPGQRGRLVPPSVILGMTHNPKNFDRLTKIVDEHAFYDNQGAKPTRVFGKP